MEFIPKLIFFVIVAGTSARSVINEQYLSNNTDDEVGTLEETYSNNTELDTLENQDSNYSSSSDEMECNCNWRYLRHYQTKGCFIEQFDACWCPKKFHCPENETLDISSKVCIYQNKEYQIGSKIMTSNTCQVCRCRQGEPPFMSCISKECPPLDPVPGTNCHLTYKENYCCPDGYQCLEKYEIEDEARSVQTCEYNGRLYPFGSKIYPENDPCQICMCDENWIGVSNISCYVQDCIFEQNKPRLDAGCIPVYHENRCCPIEYYCPSSNNGSYSLTSENETENAETSDGDKCLFGGKLFDVGTEIPLDNPCITCSCVVPPDFTCVHRSCPPSPNDESCYPVYNSAECCPSYECLMADAQPESEAICPTPLCADSSCYVGTLPGHECPTCICGENNPDIERNNLQEQQHIQQINQNFDTEMYEGPRNTAEDYSEDELQMMPFRMQDSEGAFTVLEKIVLPEFEDVERNPEEELRELDDISIEKDSSVDEITAFQESSEHFSEKEINEFDVAQNDSDSKETSKEIQKRSDITDAPVTGQHNIEVPGQQADSSELHSANEEIEREGESLEDEKDLDELETFKNKIFTKKNTIINEIFTINHEVPVPDGCPTPMCEGPWCKIGIPQGHRCPTCICKRHFGEEP